MRSVIGLKNMLIFSAILLTFGSVSAQQAFAGAPVPVLVCTIEPTSANVQISEKDGSGFVEKKITCNQDIVSLLGVSGTNCFNYDFSAHEIVLNDNMVEFVEQITNIGPLEPEHCEVKWAVETASRSVGQVTQELWIDVPDRPIGGTVGSMDTATLLVAGAQANMGLWSLALVGIVGAGAAIIYKTKSKKTEK